MLVVGLYYRVSGNVGSAASSPRIRLCGIATVCGIVCIIACGIDLVVGLVAMPLLWLVALFALSFAFVAWFVYM